MKVINSKEELVEISSQGKTFVQFSATWCGPCKMLTSTVERIENEYPNINFVKVDVDQNRDLALEYSVRGIPKIVVLDNGSILTEAVGAKTEQQIKEILEV
jgi:thioredoxin 1